MSESRVPVNIAVLTVTDTRDESTDKSGKLLIERLKEAGHVLHEKCILLQCGPRRRFRRTAK